MRGELIRFSSLHKVIRPTLLYVYARVGPFVLIIIISISIRYRYTVVAPTSSPATTLLHISWKTFFFPTDIHSFHGFTICLPKYYVNFAFGIKNNNFRIWSSVAPKNISTKLSHKIRIFHFWTIWNEKALKVKYYVCFPYSSIQWYWIYFLWLLYIKIQIIHILTKFWTKLKSCLFRFPILFDWQKLLSQCSIF